MRVAFPSKSGIYKIENKINGDFYIGSSVNMRIRRAGHLDLLRRKIHSSPILQRAYNKYGEDNLFFQVIEFCALDELVVREQFYIDTLHPRYNIATCVVAPRIGVKHTESTRNAISKKTRQMWNDPETRQRMLKNRKYQNLAKKLTKEKVIEIRRLWDTGQTTVKQLMSLFGTNKSNMHNIIHRKTWKWVTE